MIVGNSQNRTYYINREGIYKHLRRVTRKIRQKILISNILRLCLVSWQTRFTGFHSVFAHIICNLGETYTIIEIIISRVIYHQFQFQGNSIWQQFQFQGDSIYPENNILCVNLGHDRSMCVLNLIHRSADILLMLLRDWVTTSKYPKIITNFHICCTYLQSIKILL